MAKIQKELVLTNITFEVLSGESGKLIYPDPLEQTVIADGSYHVRLGALTDAQVKELFALCNPAGIHASEITGVGDSYRTVIVGLSIESKHPGVMFVIPDRTQNPYVTIKLSHIPGTDWIDLVSIKPYTPGEDEFMHKMQSIIGELKEFADKTETPVVTAEQPKISNRVTLHGAILRKVTRVNSDVVKFIFDIVSTEDLDVLVKLYDDHPLMKRPMDRHPLTFNTKGGKHEVTLGIYTQGSGYKSYTPLDTPIDIAIELHKGQINPIIYDVTLSDTPLDSKVNSNIKKEECVMSERTHTIELNNVIIRKGVLPEECDERHHIAIKIFSANDDVHKRIFKMYEDCPLDLSTDTKRRYMPSRDGKVTTVVIFVPNADEIDMGKVYDYYSTITLSLESLLVPGSTLINAVVKHIKVPGIGEWDGLPKKQHEDEKCESDKEPVKPAEDTESLEKRAKRLVANSTYGMMSRSFDECIKETSQSVQAIDPKSDIAKKLEESILAISANPGETIWIDSLGCKNETKNSGGTTMQGTISIEKLFFSGTTTIIMWTDGTKTVVQPIKGEKFDPEMGIAMAIARKLFGSRHQFNKFTANVFRESYARDAKSLTERELLMLLPEYEKIIASAKAKHDAVHQAYEKAVSEGSKKLPKLYGLKSDPDYRYAAIRISVIKAELESRKAKKAARAASTKKDSKKPTTAKKPSTRKKSAK